MQLKLTNTLTNKLESFAPIDNKNIRIYVCGPTVYDNPHLGNGRALVVYDVLFRILRHIYDSKYITYVRNITDIDDKIINRARELNISIKSLTEKVVADFEEDTNYLNCLVPTYQPKATDTISEIIEIIKLLVAKKHAYEAGNHIYFDTQSFKEYGKLAGKELDNLIAGARVEIDKNKRQASDFVLWKPADDEDKECSYDSPWGKGRPGWHIECSAMSHKFLGADFDIHGGGADLMFPHHTNEIAQSCCAFEGSKFARFWVHNGFLTVSGEKMSKSLGNFITISDLRTEGIKGEVIRLLLLGTHYRAPLDYNEKALYDAKNSMDYLYRAISILDDRLDNNESELPTEFIQPLLDDLNTHKAIAYMLELAKNVNKAKEDRDKVQFAHKLRACGNLLGFFSEPSYKWFGHDSEDAYEIEKLITMRRNAKEAKNWQEADRIREILKYKDIILEDRPDGSTEWRRK